MTQINVNDKITDQKSRNQINVENEKPNILFGCLPEKDLAILAENSGTDFVKPRFIYNYLQLADKFIRKSRMPKENKNTINLAISLLLDIIPKGFFSIGLEYYEFRAVEYYPEELRDKLEDPASEMTKEEISKAAYYEVEMILADWLYNRYDSECWQDTYNIIEEYMDIIAASGYPLKDHQIKEFNNDINRIERLFGAEEREIMNKYGIKY